MQEMSNALQRITDDLGALGASWYQGNHEKVLLDGWVEPGQAYRAYRVRLPSGGIRNFHSLPEITQWVTEERAKRGAVTTLDRAGNLLQPWTPVWWYDALFNSGYGNAPVRAIYLTTRATKTRNIGIVAEMRNGSWKPTWVETQYIEQR